MTQTNLEVGDRVNRSSVNYERDAFGVVLAINGRVVTIKTDSGRTVKADCRCLEFVPSPERVAELCAHFREVNHNQPAKPQTPPPGNLREIIMDWTPAIGEET